MSRIPDIYRNDVRTAMVAVTALGPMGAFSGAADMAAVGGTWGTLLYAMCKKSRISLDKEAAKKLSITMFAAASGYYGGCKLATKLLHMIPGAGTIMAMGMSAITNLIFTYRFAFVVATLLTDTKLTLSTLMNVAPDIGRMMIGCPAVADIKDMYSIWKRV